MSTATTSLDRCWVTSKQRQPWVVCPLCGASLKWVRLWNGEWSPCDEVPVLFTFDAQSKTQIVVKRELVHGKAYRRGQDAGAVKLGRLPHYYSCPVLLEERRAWARDNNRRKYQNGKKYP